jgi:release factor glutamine methyltransferase
MKISIGNAITSGAQALTAAGIEPARTEAASLMSHVVERDRAFILTHPEQLLTEIQLQAFRQCVDRRAAGEPLQYITGHQEFFKLDFQVTPDVLIPRPETEIIVEAALDISRGKPSPLIAEIGTGSGCVIVSILHELPDATALATDISGKALRVARGNAERHHVGDRLAMVQANCFEAFAPVPIFSLIVSNPPYIPEDEMTDLQREVRDYEPTAALVSGADGLSHIRRLLHEAPSFVQRHGYFVFEIGFGQRDAVEALVDSDVWNLVEIRTDLQSIPRTVVLQKR